MVARTRTTLHGVTFQIFKEARNGSTPSTCRQQVDGLHIGVGRGVDGVAVVEIDTTDLADKDVDDPNA